MEEQELKTKVDTNPIPEGQDEGTGMGAIWDIQRFRRLLERAESRVKESASKT